MQNLKLKVFKLSFDDARNTLTGKFYSQHDLIDSEVAKAVKELYDEHTTAKALYAHNYSDKRF
jgi:C-terminal processing protease CtpA/Prc